MRTVFKLFIQCSVLNEFSVESRPKLFKLELGSGGGGGGDVTLAPLTFFVLMSETSVLLGPFFNHDKTKLRTKLTWLLRMNLETIRIPPSIMLPVLSFSV